MYFPITALWKWVTHKQTRARTHTHTLVLFSRVLAHETEPSQQAPPSRRASSTNGVAPEAGRGRLSDALATGCTGRGRGSEKCSRCPQFIELHLPHPTNTVQSRCCYCRCRHGTELTEEGGTQQSWTHPHRCSRASVSTADRVHVLVCRKVLRAVLRAPAVLTGPIFYVFFNLFFLKYHLDEQRWIPVAFRLDLACWALFLLAIMTEEKKTYQERREEEEKRGGGGGGGGSLLLFAQCSVCPLPAYNWI